jgi:hypothetical protein
MKYIELPFPELLGIAATRGMLGAGLALLFGKHLDEQTRRVCGLVLTTIGIVSTAPFVYDILRRRSE